MACLHSDGSLTKSAQRVMVATKTPATDAEIATEISYPVYLVRSTLRQLTEVEYVSENDGQYSLTEEGLQKLQT